MGGGVNLKGKGNVRNREWRRKKKRTRETENGGKGYRVEDILRRGERRGNREIMGERRRNRER